MHELTESGAYSPMTLYDCSCGSPQEHLLRSPAVKDIHADRRLTRALMWETGSTDPFQGDAAGKGGVTGQGDVAAGPAPTANFHHGVDENFVRRRPGRCGNHLPSLTAIGTTHWRHH